MKIIAHIQNNDTYKSFKKLAPGLTRSQAQAQAEEVILATHLQGALGPEDLWCLLEDAEENWRYQDVPQSRWQKVEHTVLKHANHNAREALEHFFQPDPHWSIHITGDIHPEMIPPLIIEVDKLQAKNPKKAITVYIDSNGGVVECIYELQRHFRAHGLRMISVVPRFAASAAAILATLSHHAAAYPQAVLMYHGVRFGHRAVTKEFAIRGASDLEQTNDEISSMVTRKIFERLADRLQYNYKEIIELRDRVPQEMLNLVGSDIVAAYIFYCFTASDRVSTIKDLLDRCIARISNLATLHKLRTDLHDEAWNSPLGKSIRKDIEKIIKKQHGDTVELNSQSIMDKKVDEYIRENTLLEDELPLFHAVVLRCFRVNEESRDLTIERNLLTATIDLYVETREFMNRRHEMELGHGAPNYLEMFFNAAEMKRLQEIFAPQKENSNAEHSDSDKDLVQRLRGITDNVLRPLYFFALALARSIQTDDFYLDARQAYRLGLIDEVIGTDDCKTYRKEQVRGFIHQTS
jgi:ATP-dependent protease ClpP protease subunit